MSICFYVEARHNHNTHKPPGNFRPHGEAWLRSLKAVFLPAWRAKSQSQDPDQKDPGKLHSLETSLLEISLVLEL